MEYRGRWKSRSTMELSTEENRFNPEFPDIFIVHIHICIPIFIYACIVINIFVLKAQSHLL